MKNSVTKELIDSKIANVTYTKMPSGKCLICEITLVNGFTVRGEASVVDPDNFNEEIGKPIAYQKAFDKIWELEGYLLQEKLYQSSVNGTVFTNPKSYASEIGRILDDRLEDFKRGFNAVHFKSAVIKDLLNLK